MFVLLYKVYKTAQEYLRKVNFQMFFYLSLFKITKLFLKSKYLFLFKLNQFMDDEKTFPGDDESSLKILLT